MVDRRNLIDARRSIRMGLVGWSPSLSVGVGEIDEHHARLSGMITRLHSSMKLSRGVDGIALTASPTA